MRRRCAIYDFRRTLRLSCIGLTLATMACQMPTVAHAANKSTANLGSRWELLIDRWLIDSSENVTLELNQPERREVVLVVDKPWEGHTSAYFCTVQDGDLVRLYYRGSSGSEDKSEGRVTCMAESRDGIHFTRPNLGLIEIDGSTENNVVWHGIESSNFAVFIDTNPACQPEQRYKGLAGSGQAGRNWKDGEVPAGLYALASPDGIHWHKIWKEPVLTDGRFDSLNLAFWDPARKRYASYSRISPGGVRSIQHAHSSDFRSWSQPILNRYAKGAPQEHFYTNSTIPCPGAEHILLAFPKRFVPSRQKVASHEYSGVSDAVFLSSRDGKKWDRTFLEAWVRPGRDPLNWTERNNMPAWGIVETAPGEWSMYISEHFRRSDNRMRRLVLPRHRIASASAPAAGGEFTTRPVTFDGNQLVLNYATSATGSVQIEIQDEAGQPINGFALSDMPPLFGDELDATVRWKSDGDVSALAGKPVRLRIVLKDADLYALRFNNDKAGD